MARTEYELTEEQFNKIMDASKSVPYLIAGGIPPRSPQENANAAWARLGRELGFKPMTVRPVEGTQTRFTAEPAEASEGDGCGPFDSEAETLAAARKRHKRIDRNE